MSLGAYLAGCALLAWTLGACAVAAARIVRPAGLVGWLGWATVLSGVLAFVHVAPLALGALSRGAVAVAVAIALVCAWRFGRRVELTPPPSTGTGAMGPAALLAVVLVAGFVLAAVTLGAGGPPTGLDAQNFQLPQVARWIQTGTAWRLDQYIVDFSNTTYPHMGNVMLLVLVLPWSSTFAAELATVPFLGLVGAGVFACVRELGGSRRAAALAGCLLAAVPVVARVGVGGAMSDAPMLAWLVAGVLFLLRQARTGARADLVLAGVGLGLAFGAKWYAVTAVPLIAAAWLVGRRRPSEVLVLAGTVAATGGFWLARNWVETGNPLFPQPLLGLFPAPPDPHREQFGFSLAHYALDVEVWRTYVRPAFAVFLGPPGLVLVGGSVAAAVLGARGGRRRPRDPRVLAVGLATFALAAVYVVTPYSAIGVEGAPTGIGFTTRYGLPALLGAALLTGWALGRLRGRPVRFLAEAIVLLAVLDGLSRASDSVTAGRWLLACLAVGTGGLALAVARRLAPAGPGRATVAGLAAAAVLVALVGGDALRRRANTSGYGAAEPALAAIEARAPSGARIGVAGRWTNEGVSPVLASFGRRLGNEVTSVGPYVEGMLRRPRDPRAFRATLARQGYDLLVVGRADSGGAPAREEAWARAAGWRTVSASPRLALLAAPEG